MTDELPPFPARPRVMLPHLAVQYSADVAAWSAEAARVSFERMGKIEAALGRIEAKLNGGKP